MGVKFALSSTIGAFGLRLAALWKQRRANRDRPPITPLIQLIAIMPDDELQRLYDDYVFLSAVDSEREFKQIRDACFREIQWRAALPTFGRTRSARQKSRFSALES